MITELNSKLRQVNSFVDETFDLHHLSHFHLVLQVGNDGLLAAVLEKEKNKYIAFEYYSFQQVYDFDMISDLFDIALKESKILGHNYRSVSCAVVNALSTLVPAALFEEDRRKLYLKTNVSLEGNELIMTDQVRNLEAKNVFALPLSLKAKLDGTYLKVRYHHFSSVLIEELLSRNRNEAKKKLYIHLQPSHFETLVIEGKNLLFYNSFNYHTAEDLMYYVLFVCEQLQLNPENIEVSMIGEIERSSAIFNLAQKYLRNLKFAERADNSDFGYQLQTLPKHFYFCLFNNYLA